VGKRFEKLMSRPRASRGGLAFVLALPLLPAALRSLLNGDLQRLLVHAGAFAVALLGAHLLRQGSVAAEEYQRRQIALPPRLPRKLLGSLALGLAAGGTAALSLGQHWSVALAYAAATTLGSVLVYGADPRQVKGAAQPGAGYTPEEVQAALAEGERAVTAIEEARSRLRNPELARRLGRIAELARRILAEIESDPRDLRRARKFLTVYLEGAQRVAAGYARTHPRAQSGELEVSFQRVLGSIEGVFIEQHQKLLEHDVLDLDVQIEVLTKQLEREGVV
jgi:hypothetical protein